MTNKKFTSGFVALVFALAICGCSGGADGGSGGGGGVPQTVKELPSFEGTPVATETEAMSLAAESMVQIQLAISEAMTAEPVLSMSRSIYESGNYSYNGVTLQYTVTVTGDPPFPPYTMNVSELVTIDGTYYGYTIKGVGLDIKSEVSSLSEANLSSKYRYNCAYTVSKDGKGMKVVYSGTSDTTLNGETYSTEYKLHYAIYDNSNNVLFSIDYEYP